MFVFRIQPPYSRLTAAVLWVLMSVLMFSMAVDLGTVLRVAGAAIAAPIVTALAVYAVNPGACGRATVSMSAHAVESRSHRARLVLAARAARWSCTQDSDTGRWPSLPLLGAPPSGVSYVRAGVGDIVHHDEHEIVAITTLSHCVDVVL
jgi:hypothetical protein